MTHVELVGVSAFLFGAALTSTMFSIGARPNPMWAWIALVVSLVMFAFVRRD